jgi:hypothetical protein
VLELSEVTGARCGGRARLTVYTHVTCTPRQHTHQQHTAADSFIRVSQVSKAAAGLLSLLLTTIATSLIDLRTTSRLIITHMSNLNVI